MGVQIVTVSCTECSRRFRTVWSVVEHHAPRTCSNCGALLEVSAPQPVCVLSRHPLACDEAA